MEIAMVADGFAEQHPCEGVIHRPNDPWPQPMRLVPLGYRFCTRKDAPGLPLDKCAGWIVSARNLQP